MMSLHETKTKVIRKNHLAEKIVIVDGQPGCGKTMMSPIVASLNRVELVSYGFEIEFICRLFHLKKIDDDAAIAMVRMLTDHKLYQTMMGRDVNFRFTDLSSVFKDSNPWRYFKRIFQEGDLVIPQRIKKEKPILNLTTHDLLSVSEPIYAGLGSRVVLIEVVRHPLYMVKQQFLNMTRLMDNPRDIQICVEYNGRQLPYIADGWEDHFCKINDMDKTIISMQKMARLNDEKRKVWNDDDELSIITIPFEKFVIEPSPYMNGIERILGTRKSIKTGDIMKKQNVPRKMLADSPASAIYKRCGWEPPGNDSEKVELDLRRDYVAQNASAEGLAIIDELSEEYTAKFLSDKK